MSEERMDFVNRDVGILIGTVQAIKENQRTAAELAKEQHEELLASIADLKAKHHDRLVILETDRIRAYTVGGVFGAIVGTVIFIIEYFGIKLGGGT